MIPTRRTVLTGLAGLPLLTPGRAAAAAGAVEVRNDTYPTQCAEEDNVFLTLHAERLSAFRFEATHPAYIGEVRVDSYQPDFTNCHFGPTPPETGPFFTPRQFVMWESADHVMVFNTDRHFWRPRSVPVRVGGRTEENIHLIQFYRKRPNGHRDQVVVLYPTDGHWRLKPLPVPHLDYNVYGASVLVGPVEAYDRRKPYVDYTDVVFDPATLTFTVRFDRGGSATLRVAEVSRERTALDVAFDAAVPSSHAFAALRSMYVTADNADIATTRYRAPDGAVREVAIGERLTTPVTDLVFARTVVSRHNTSAPDQGFRAFAFR